MVPLRYGTHSLSQVAATFIAPISSSLLYLNSHFHNSNSFQIPPPNFISLTSFQDLRHFLISISTREMAEQSVELPEECWELILNSLDQRRDFESLSLVCTRLLSITNQLRLSFNIANPAVQFLPRLFHRFHNLREIDFRGFEGDLNTLLFQISRSGLDLKSINLSDHKNFPLVGLKELGWKMKNLRELHCSKMGSLQNSDLVAIADYFQFLEVLDISNPENGGRFPDSLFSGFVTDSGISALSSKLIRLQKIDLSGNQFITDQSLLSLSLNCALLREITILNCDFITQNGLGIAMCNAKNLYSVSVNGIGIPSMELSFQESFAYTRSLREIEISDSLISNELLYLVAAAGLLLRKLSLSRCTGFTFNGISFLLQKYQFLEHLDLEGANFLSNYSINQLLDFLQNISSINLNSCHKLTSSSFFALIRSCPKLNDVKMEMTNLGLEVVTEDVVKSPQVRSLQLAQNCNLCDDCMTKLAFACPSLEILNVSYCSDITEKGMSEILGSCRNIKHLEINRCLGINNLKIEFDLPNLEVLRAHGSKIDDDTLKMIGKSCHRLLHLGLESCMNVTMSGVKEVVGKCRLLREINLQWCYLLKVDIVAWLVSSRPSLRTIVPPCGFVPTQNQRDFYLRHGCYVCDG